MVFRLHVVGAHLLMCWFRVGASFLCTDIAGFIHVRSRGFLLHAGL